MRCWAVTVDLGGREFEIPALPAVDWWPIIASADPVQILDMLKSSSEADEFALDTMLLDGALTGADLSTALKDVVEEVTGRTMQAAFVLAVVANSRWSVVGGQLAREGFRWDLLPIGAALDAIYAIVVESFPHGKEGDQARDKFLALLEDDSLTRPGGKRAPSERVVSEFEAMAGPRPAPAPLPGKASAEPSGDPPPRTRTQPRQPRQGGRSGAPKTRP